MEMKKKEIVILGGGFAGSHTYSSLPSWVKKQHNVRIIDEHDHFLFTPLLPEVAGSVLDVDNVSIQIKDIVKDPSEFIQSRVISVDIQKKEVSLADDTILSYDYLVSAIGARTFFYGTPGADTYALVLKTAKDALAIKQRCLDLFEKASLVEDAVERKKILSFIVIGGGPTGIELVSEIGELMHKVLVGKYTNITKEDVSITVINGGDRVLQMFSPSLSQYAENSLSANNIVIKPGLRVTEIKKESILTNTGEEIFAQTIIWTAGVSAIDLPSTCNTFKKERARICIEKDLRLPDDSSTFILGDMALYPTDDGRGLPMTAQVARQQGKHTAKNLVALLHNKPTTEFIYKEKGILASLGSFDAIGEVFGLQLKGAFAWFMWRGVYLGLFNSWSKRLSLVATWTRSLFLGRKI